MRPVQKRCFFGLGKRKKVSESHSKNLVVDDQRGDVKISVDDMEAALSTEVLSDETAREASRSSYSKRNRYYKYTLNALLFGAAVGSGFGVLYGMYYRASDAEYIQLTHNRPRTARLLRSVHIIPETVKEKYSKYDYSLYIARLAAAVLSDPAHTVDSIDQLIHLLSEWLDVSSIQFDTSLPFTHKNIVMTLSKVQSLPDSYIVFILGERCYGISPITVEVQKEISAFYDYAKEEGDDHPGVHRLYVLSILKHIQSHYGIKLQSSVSTSTLFDPLRRNESTQTRLIDDVKALPSDFISFLQLTNILACANRQIPSDTLLIYRLRLAAKKVEGDRNFAEQVKKESILPLLPIPLLQNREKEEPAKSVEQQLEEEIAKAAERPVVSKPPSDDPTEEWW